ncbi:MAG: VCBS repeat-containing protein [Bacteroidota bacterium]
MTFRSSVCLCLLILLLSYCAPAPAPDGATLAKIHCSSCHQFPEPGHLDQKSWREYILPRMGYALGVLPVDSVGGGFIEPFAEAAAFSNPMLFRKEASVTKAEWQAIRDYYLAEAPVALPGNQEPEVTIELPQFKVNFPNHFLSPPSSTLVRMGNDQLFVGDAHTRKLYIFDDEGQLLKAANAGAVPVWLNDHPEGYLVTNMGAFSPTDAGLGQVVFLPKKATQQAMVLIDSLRRPVHTELADLDQDGISDLLICEFAKWTGGLAWWKNNGRGGFERKPLRNMPGAMKAYARDLNGDQRLDIVALFGQGDEGIFAFYNEGEGRFREERLLRFPPSHGSSYFKLFDYNQDGHLDIIYTCGDNADFPPINKPYHGIYIFSNDGQNQFTQSFFHPMYGAYAAHPEDFDQDGDLDIAAIAFFPDFKQAPQSGFRYLENQGEMKMRAYTFPGAQKGRWIVMDAADQDGDGDQDLILGALAFEVIPKQGLVEQWVKEGIPYVVLENVLR